MKTDFLFEFSNLATQQYAPGYCCYPGDILEFGTGSGKSTIEIARFIERFRVNKKIFTFDGFVGLPKTNKVIPTNSDWQPGNLKFCETETRSALRPYRCVSVFKTMIDEIQDLSLYGVDRVAAVNFDLDLYEGTRDALNLIIATEWNKILLRFDDWGAYENQVTAEVAQHEQLAFFEFIEKTKYDWNFLPYNTKINKQEQQAVIEVTRGATK